MGKKRFVSFLLLLSVAIFFVGCGKNDTPSKLSEEDLLQELVLPTVMITVGEFHASGVIIDKSDEEIVIASVAHLLSGYDQGIITFSDMHVGFGNVFYCNEADDICLLRIPRTDFDEAYYESLKYAAIDLQAYENLTKDDTLIIAGSAISGVNSIFKGTFKAKDYYVPEFDQYMIYMYCDIFEGMSGSAVYTEDGFLIGLLAGGSDAAEAVCIPVTDVVDRWKNGGM